MLNKGVWLGLRVGAKTGFVASALYSLPLIIICFLGTPIAGLVAAGVAFIIGILPGTGVGVITGALVGWGLDKLAHSINSKQARLLGVLVAVAMVAVVHLALQLLQIVQLTAMDSVGYWFFLGIPSLLYTFLSGVIAKQLFAQLQLHTLAGAITESTSPQDKWMLAVGIGFIGLGSIIGFASIKDWPNPFLVISLVAILLGSNLLWLFKPRPMNK